ncbi:hypothetical protein [Pseudomonas sp.]|uniref:hypothetical protein n=1 Tax=Pseudomonas sp. TaxID=306 RepID=UPI003A983D7E
MWSHHLEEYEPSGRSACLCGSGERFKNCCKEEYRKKDNFKYVQDLNAPAKQQLKHLRAHICWYRICHKAHTVKMLRSNSEGANRLLSIDIVALKDFVWHLERCYQANQIESKFEFALDELSQAIDDERWQLEIDMIRALHVYCREGTRSRAKKIISKYNPKQVKNPELIELYLDVYSDELNSIEIVALSDRVADLSESDSSRLQYRFLSAMQYFLLRDMAEGKKRALLAIKEYEKVPESSKTIYGRVRLAGAYKTLGELVADDELILQAIKEYRGLIERSELNSSGLADVWGEIGDCQRHLKDFDSSEYSYRKSLELHDEPLTRVF